MDDVIPGEGVVPGRRRRPSGEPPPLPHDFDVAAIAWLVAFLWWAAIWLWVFISDDPAIWITERDLEMMRPIVDLRTTWLTPTMQVINEIGTHWASVVIGWTTLLGAIAFRRVRHAILFFASQSVIAGLVTLVATRIGRPRPLGMTQLGDWEGYAQPSRPVALLTGALVAAGLTLFRPRPWRRRWYLMSIAVLGVFGFAQVYTGVDHPTDVVVGGTVAVAVTLLLYRSLAPEAAFPIVSRAGKTAHLDVTGARGEAIRAAMSHQIGFDVDEIVPVGGESSAGSTPLRIVGRNGDVVFAKLYSSVHLRSDRWFKLARTLLYGRLEDEARFSSVRRLIQHEHYMLHLFCAAGAGCQEPIGIVEITPEREYLLVTEFIDDAVEISEAAVTEELIDQGLALVAKLWRAGLAHRDVKPANVLVQRGRLRIVDVAFGQIRPSPWRQAVDLANMMLVLALGNSPELVYERARRVFSDEELGEAFAASRGVAFPSQLRSAVRTDARHLLQRFRELAPQQKPVAIQRWSLRRLGLTLWVALIALAILAIFLGSLADIGLA